jgi:hypothetical protein
MPSVTKTVELRVPQEDAFRLATDPSRFEEWLTLHSSWPNGIPISTEAGSEFTQTLVLLGMPSDVAWKVEECVAPTRFVLRGSGPMGAQLSTTIIAADGGDGSTISYEAEFSGGAIEGPIGEVVTKKAGEELETSLGNLKTLAG